MIGKNNPDLVKMKNNLDISADMDSLYFNQSAFQSMVTDIGIMDFPVDDPKWFSYHISSMIEELGELLKADKRWKTHRNISYNPKEKLDELADVCIITMNLALFSGFGWEEVRDAVAAKIIENIKRLNEKENEEDENK